MDELVEAHAPEAFLGKVQGLEQGEVARLEGGVAVKRMALDDGRDAFVVARPRRWSWRGEPDFDGDALRTPEDAVQRAFRFSAESTDPESIGGGTALRTYGDWEVEDEAGSHRIHGFSTAGKAILRTPAGTTIEVDPGKLRRPGPSVAEGLLTELPQDAALSESAKTAGYSVTHAPRGSKGNGRNWIENDKPGGSGQLPAYIQNVRNGIMRDGTAESRATAIAIGRVRTWAREIGRSTRLNSSH